jgi:hypothetical protein
MGGVGRVRVRVGVSLACGALILGISASPSIAKKGKKKGLGAVVTRSAVSPPGTTTAQLLTATATCPKGKKAFGGGFAAPPVDSSSLVFIHESRRTGARTWTASGTFFAISGTPTPLSVTSSVYCRRLAKTPQEVTTSVPVLAATNNTPATAIARCQGDKQKLLSGGFLYSPPANGNVAQALVYENQPAGKSWRASVQNSGASPARTLTGYAYCAKGLKSAPKIISGNSAATLPTVLARISASSVGCPGKSRLSAGGFVSPFPTTTPMTARPLYFESQISGTTWRASALAGFGPGPLSITALGICT